MDENYEENNVKLIDIDGLKLNRKNYRIYFNTGITEEQVVKKLFDEEGIVKLAESIVQYGGLYAYENIIAVKEGDKNIVLEGNRRTLAIQCLLHDNFVPEDYKNQYSKIRNKTTKEGLNKIRRVQVFFVKNREEAIPLIANKHFGSSSLSWPSASQWFYYKDTWEKMGKDLEKSADQLKANKNDIISSIKYINILIYIRNLNLWEQNDLNKEINKNRLDYSRLTRAINIRDVKNALELEFDSYYNIKPPNTMSNDEFNCVLFNFAKATLIDNSKVGINTRTPTYKIVEAIGSWKKEYVKNDHFLHTTSISFSGNVKDNKESQTNEKPKQKSIPKYFENLTCSINDHKLLKLSDEISKLKIENYSIAASMLTRALIELSLTYRIKKKNLWNEFKNAYKGQHSLSDIISFSITNAKLLFNDPNIAKPIGYLQGKNGYRSYLNDIVHTKLIPTPGQIETIAADTKELIQAILNDTA